jgi:hypothetical protein
MSKILVLLCLMVESSQPFDRIDMFSNEDETVYVDEIEQDRLIKQAEWKCQLAQLDSVINGNYNENTSLNYNNKLLLTKHFKEYKKCPIVWDGVICWPATSVNVTVRIKCPNYIDKFNIKSNF